MVISPGFYLDIQGRHKKNYGLIRLALGTDCVFNCAGF